jgi:hypothetical protein
LVEQEDGTWTLPATADSAGTCSIHPEFALPCSATDPRALAAIKAFLADAGEPLQQQGAMSMESRVSPRDAQQKWQPVYQAFGDMQGAPGILNGESDIDYRVRLVSKFQQHSKVFKDSDLAKIAGIDVKTFEAIEDSIRADAMGALQDPSTFQDGELREVRTQDPSGRTITKYLGRDGALWDRINPPYRLVRRFMTPASR